MPVRLPVLAEDSAADDTESAGVLEAAAAAVIFKLRGNGSSVLMFEAQVTEKIIRWRFRLQLNRKSV